MSTTLGQNIRKYRKLRQLTVRALADRVAISVSALEKYERGDRVPTASVVTQLARVLHVGPDRLHGQPWAAEPADGELSVVPELRRILLTYDTPDAAVLEPRPLEVLTAEMDQVARMRQDGQYVQLAPLLPGLLTELTHLALGGTPAVARDRRALPQPQARAFRQLAVGYRAANSLAHKLGYHDLSYTACERVHWAADRSGDPLMQATAAYLRAGAMIRMGALGSARTVLEGLADEVERMAPELSLSPEHMSVLGAVLLKLAVVEARDGRPQRAMERLAEAAVWAEALRVDTTHYEMSFGPANVRIHEVAILSDTGDTEQALARLREWGGEQGVDEWELPDGLAAERASHHHIDVAAAKLAEGDRAGTHRSLLEARRIAPMHTRHHPTVRATAGALLRLDRGADDSIAGLARWAGV